MSNSQPFMYTAAELFSWLSGRPDFVLLDVRNENEFTHWYIETPSVAPYINIPYYDFIEDLAGSLAKIPAKEKVRIVCAKEGSAKYVAEQLCANGFADVGYLQGGIVAWGSVLIPRKISGGDFCGELYQCIRPGKGACSYVLIAGREAMVFDASRNVEFYRSFVEGKGAVITHVFETHRQADYLSGSSRLAVETGARFLAHDNDFHGAGFPFTPIRDREVYRFADGAATVQAVHTPGHTLGSTSYLVNERFLLTGDTVFISTAGRPDLGGKSEEWSRVLYLTLTIALRHLDDSVLVCPGHYSNWQEANGEQAFVESLGVLRARNVAFQLPTELHFSRFIRDHLRPQPAVYAKIREANGGWLAVDPAEADTMDFGKHECGASNYGAVGVSAEVLRTHAEVEGTATEQRQ